MTIAISPIMCFPPVTWWMTITRYEQFCPDRNEPFRKMTWRNRYRIASANGILQLSVPVKGGREQRGPIGTLLIDNKPEWQKQHWRSLFSVYGRAPFFEHYGPELEQLFIQPYEYLADFNLASIRWALKGLRMPQDMMVTTDNISLKDAADLRTGRFDAPDGLPAYSQVFDDRTGFIPNLSVIDLLMNEGPAARRLLA